MRITNKIITKILFTGITFLTIHIGSTYAQCGMALRDILLPEIGEATYLKDFRMRFEETEKVKKKQKHEFTILLNKGTHYRFNVMSDTINEDRVLLEIYDFSKKIGQNYDPDDNTSYDEIDFFCSKTQVYYIMFSFANASKGCVAAIVSYVENYDTRSTVLE